MLRESEISIAPSEVFLARKRSRISTALIKVLKEIMVSQIEIKLSIKETDKRIALLRPCVKVYPSRIKKQLMRLT